MLNAHKSKNIYPPLMQLNGLMGFTFVELLVVLAIIGVLASISIPMYVHFINKAKITVAESTLLNVRGTLLNHIIGDNTSFPLAIDFTTGIDEQGHTVFQQPLRDEIKKDLFLPTITYNSEPDGFTITAQANDTDHTLFIMTENSLNIQGH